MKRVGPAALGLAIWACGPTDVAPTPGSEGVRVHGDARLGGEVVATVDGFPITLMDVEHAARSAGVPPRVALRRLEDETLLAQAAERAGRGADGAVRRARRQAAVQALLARAIESEPVDVDEARVAEIFEQSRARFQAPQRRESVHLVARVDPAAAADVAARAEAWIRAAHARLTAAPDPAAEALAIARRPPQTLPFAVEAEEVDPLARDADTDAAYLGALFSLEEPGLSPEVVRTVYGWHAIVCTRIEPAVQVSREEALEIVRGEMVAAVRARALLALQAELARSFGVEVSQPAIRLLDDPRVMGPGG